MRRSTPVTTVGQIAEVMRAARELSGMSQGKLADRLRVSRRWVSLAERGYGSSAVRYLDALAVLGVTVTLSFDDEES